MYSPTTIKMQAHSLFPVWSAVLPYLPCAAVAANWQQSLAKKGFPICSSGGRRESFSLISFDVQPNGSASILNIHSGIYRTGFFNTVIWAMITDVIDDAEVKNGVRRDGTVYAVSLLQENWTGIFFRYDRWSAIW